MITQTLAIFYDAYRQINARKMFWVVLGLSLLVVAAMACVGFGPGGLSILWWDVSSASEFSTQHMSAPAFYKYYVVQAVGVDIWLSWVACILALISTAGIYPDFLSSGSIDLSLSKPIGRVRLFLTQYVAGLLFVTLQVAVFSIGSFFVVGFRAGSWDPKMLLAIPLVVCFFSYLFSVCALMGVLTRSTLASLLVTMLFWFLLWGLHTAETGFGNFAVMQEHQVELIERDLAERKTRPPESQAATSQPWRDPDGNNVTRLPRTIEDHEKDLAGKRETIASLREVQDILVIVKTFLPKTTETVQLIQRAVVKADELPNQDGGLGRKIVAEQESRSVAWIVGTSLGFEAVILAIGAWFFRRRDF